MTVQSVIRYLQGERPGMSAGAQAIPPDSLPNELFELLFLGISIPTQVQLADVSFWQADIDFNAMRAAGVSGVIVRAGQRSWVDARFVENWGKARNAEIPRGSYWFYDSRDTPKNQAALWASLIVDDPGELVHACDLEENYGGSYGKATHIHDFVNYFQDLSRLPDDRIANYTGYYWWIQRIGNDPFFKRFPLWLASYTAANVARVPPPWTETDLLLWQYTSSGNGAAVGVGSKEIDLSWFNGDRAAFSKRFGLDTVLPTETTMNYQAIGNITIRTGPGVSYTNATVGGVSQYVLPGDILETDLPIGGWAHIRKITRAGADVPLAPVSWCGTAYLKEIVDTPTVTLKHTVEVYSDGSLKIDGNPVP